MQLIVFSSKSLLFCSVPLILVCRPDESSSCEDVMLLVQEKLASEPGSSGAFRSLVDGMERNQVASTFLKLLVANKKEMVDLDQHDNYDEIILNIL